MIALANGRVYDPANGVAGEVRTVWIDGGRVVAAPARPPDDLVTIDVSGRVVMPGGVDMHCHIAGPPVNRARRLMAGVDGRSLVPDEVDRSRWPTTFSTRDTGLRYALLGYTTAIEAAVAPIGARQTHEELADTPHLDRGFLLLLAENPYLVECLRRGERELAICAAAALVERCGAFGIKAVNPGGGAHWREAGPDPRKLDEANAVGISPRAMLDFLAEAADRQGLPHPVHIHANQLGVAGNIDVTLATSRALAGRRHHLTHAQFHAYGRGDDGQLTSAAHRLIEHLEATPELSIDVGQVMFGEALTISADRDLEHHLWQLTGRPYVDLETDLATGCGIVPWEYRCDSRLHVRQWAIGLELFLLCRDPWRIALSTDHPNGGSFLAYPTLMAQLMDRGLREATLELADPRAVDRSRIKELAREYTLDEIAIVTRAAPARMLGLRDKGHLGPGADADVTVYNDSPERETMFRRPYLVIKGGHVVVRDGELCDELSPGTTLVTRPSVDSDAAARLERWIVDTAGLDPQRLGPRETLRDRCQTVSAMKEGQ